MSDLYFVLNRNEGTDTIHRNPREECNVDDAEGRETIDAATAEALLAMDPAQGGAVRCQHCYLEGDPS